MATLRLLRHATLLLDLGRTTFLVDPMFASAGCLPAVPGTPNHAPNPLVELPGPAGDSIGAADAVLPTHCTATTSATPRHRRIAVPDDGAAIAL